MGETAGKIQWFSLSFCVCYKNLLVLMDVFFSLIFLNLYVVPVSFSVQIDIPINRRLEVSISTRGLLSTDQENYLFFHLFEPPSNLSPF